MAKQFLRITSQMEAIAKKNMIAWVIDSILHSLGHNRDRELSIAGLCWWAVDRGISNAVTGEIARQAFRIKPELHRGTHKESDTVPSIPTVEIFRDRVALYINREPPAPKIKPVVTLKVDPESPQTLFARPKCIRWESAKYLKWVKTQPCACCGQPADDNWLGSGWNGQYQGARHPDITVVQTASR